MKRIIYIAAFTLLGILAQFVVHGLLEIGVTKLLLSDFEKYNLGLGWEGWFMVHHIGTVILLAAGIVVGFRQGVYWWEQIYEKGTRQ